MNEITEELLAEFVERMKLSDDENSNLTRILTSSIADLIIKCGAHDIHTNTRFKELVFERSRYVYNDALEYFDQNFLSQILSLSLENALSATSPSVEGTP